MAKKLTHMNNGQAPRGNGASGPNPQPIKRDGKGKFIYFPGPGRPKRKKSVDYKKDIPRVVKKIIDVINQGGNEWLREIKRNNPDKFLTFTSQILRYVELTGAGRGEAESGIGPEIMAMSNEVSPRKTRSCLSLKDLC